MSNITIPKKYTPSGGPIIDVEVDDATDPYEIGSVMSLSSGKAIPAAADATRVGVVVSHYVKGSDTFVRLDIGGALVRNCVWSSHSSTPFTPIKWVDNQTVAARSTDLGKHGGVIARVVDANTVDVLAVAASVGDPGELN